MSWWWVDDYQTALLSLNGSIALLINILHFTTYCCCHRKAFYNSSTRSQAEATLHIFMNSWWGNFILMFIEKVLWHFCFHQKKISETFWNFWVLLGTSGNFGCPHMFGCRIISSFDVSSLYSWVLIKFQNYTFSFLAFFTLFTVWLIIFVMIIYAQTCLPFPHQHDFFEILSRKIKF